MTWHTDLWNRRVLRDLDGKEASLVSDFGKWHLQITFNPRLIPDSPHDLCVVWSHRLTPELRDAENKACQILEQEWI